MTDDVLSTLMCEVDNVLNSRHLTPVTNDIDDLEALTPNHILKLRLNVQFPPGIFNNDDVYLRRKWKQIQYLAEIFWSIWWKEYLPLLIERQKWTVARRSLSVGDLVLVVDQLLPRNFWYLGRRISVRVSQGYIRSATIKVSRCKNGNDFKMETTTLDKPITKLVLLRSVEDL